MRRARMPRKVPGRLLRLLGLSVALASIQAAAAEPAETEAAAKDEAPSAFSAFIEGERAFRAGDFLEAAKRFEEAYRLTPHPDVLWNAAQAWERAGEKARAANLYDRYLAEAKAGARDRDSALAALGELAKELGRIDIVAPGIDRVLVDEQPVVGSRVYVTRGTHTVRGEVGDRRLEQTAEVRAGEALSVALVDAGPPAAPKAAKAPLAMSEKAPDAAPSRAFFPILSNGQRAVVGVEFAATVISGGLLIWSGADTLQTRLAFDEEGTPQALADGRDRQTRTNVLIATTVILGSATLATAVLFGTVGRTTIEARAAVSPGPLGTPDPSLSLRGRF